MQRTAREFHGISALHDERNPREHCLRGFVQGQTASRGSTGNMRFVASILIIAGAAACGGDPEVDGCFGGTDPLCVPQLPVAAQSGRVSLEKLSPPSGSVDATLPTGDHFSGSFAAIKCDPPPGLAAGGGRCF